MFTQRTPKGTQRGRDTRDRDVSPIKPSPRALSTNNSYYGTSNSIVPSGSGNVKVVCRVRPINQKELDLGGSLAVNIEDEKTISVKSSQYTDVGGNGLTFAFDRIFDMESTQEEIYEFTAKPVVESVLEGFNGTVFAYGQTSSGKTYTMMGPDLEDADFSGIIPRMVSTVFDYISDTPDHIEFTVKVSMIEIYMERIRDLLNPKKVNLKIREDKTKGIYIEDVTESYVSDERDVYDFLKYGHNNRTTTTTNMNETSSRSHCLFMMTIHQNNLLEMHAKTGKLCLVDLAGSEKVAKTGAIGQVLEEAKEINKSLSALGNVINALTDSRGLTHIPYRDSKLTRILQESLGGNARTSLIINCSPSSYNENETISALRFGYRAKSIKNTPKINREYTAAQLQVLLEKAEKKIVIKDKRIKVLEEILYEHDIDVPGEVLPTEVLPSSNKRKDNSYLETEEGYDGLSDNESCIKADILSPFKNKVDQQEKIKALEDELRIERLSLKKQTDNVKLLKKDLDEANSRVFMIEKENEAFINKLAAQALKIQELQEKLRDKEMKLEILQLLKDILTTENEELKKSRKSFLQDLDEENKEVLKLAQTEGLLFTPRKGGDQKGRNTGFITTEDYERRRDTYFGVIDNVTRDMIKEITQKFSIRNLQTLKEVTIPYMDKLKLAFEGQEETLKKPKEGGSEIKKKYEKLKEELAYEKQKSSKNRHEYEAFLKEHDHLDKSMIPSFDEWRQGIGMDSLREESDKDETLSFKDYSTKSTKEKKLAMNLENFKEKKKFSKLADGGNTELLSKLDRTPKANRDHDEGEPKSPLKTQRMINLEKQLHETKELVNQYKNKIESLKSMISTNPGTGSTSLKLDSTDKIENTETFRQQKQNIKQEIVSQVTEKERAFEEGHGELSPKSSVKIVKPIKGGQLKKGSIASQKFFDILKQQYRFNRNFVNGIGGESILNKQKPTEKGSKPQSEGKLKGI